MRTAVHVVCVTVVVALLWYLFVYDDGSHGGTSAIRVQLTLLTTALDDFHRDCGRYPTADEGLHALVDKGSEPKWKGPYLDPARVPADPWGTPFMYKLTATGTPEISSAGPDKAPGTRDDVTMPVKR